MSEKYPFCLQFLTLRVSIRSFTMALNSQLLLLLNSTLPTMPTSKLLTNSLKPSTRTLSRFQRCWKFYKECPYDSESENKDCLFSSNQGLVSCLRFWSVSASLSDLKPSKYKKFWWYRSMENLSWFACSCSSGVYTPTNVGPFRNLCFSGDNSFNCWTLSTHQRDLKVLKCCPNRLT